jgi:hypothetical protein
VQRAAASCSDLRPRRCRGCAGRHRQQLLIKGDSLAVQTGARAALAAAGRLRDGVSGAVDVRPWSML